ncbi:glycosyltransferase involved in cell wall biosynthesis [Pontibacter aydingkolensis]|uniref:Glycosyltransferase n=1 Tax=Pontibacter aydingkolensis TaxID=1911536 RepID=A0ABS7CTN3_9BACT|nr:glycosyltransferase family 2 protein [Pontibacter aydingkolensis]MBW7467215.1 glycosyltransferase [Pontibacter aydingkolensis]
MKISVITICYNAVLYIDRAIHSVLKQDYDNWEHIVIDGGSTDGTVEVLKKYNHLKWVSESDRGQSDAMNKGFKESSGEIIIYLNADDELNHGLFSFVANHFISSPETDMLVMNLLSINSGKEIYTTPSTSLKEILRYNPCRFPLNPVSYAYRKGLQYKTGLFPVNNHYAMDYWFLIRAYLFGNIQYKDFLGGTFYFDGNNKSADWANSCKHMKAVRDWFLIRYFYKKPVREFNYRFLIYKLHMFWIKVKSYSLHT